MLVKLIRSSGVEDDVITSAMVEQEGFAHGKTPQRFINKLMKKRHGTPFEDITLKWYVELPLFVMAQWHRHRIGWSFSVKSGRYKQVGERTWTPAPERPLKPVENFNPMEPEFTYDAELINYATEEIATNFRASYACYMRMIARGVAGEVARTVLPTSTYTEMIARCNMRSFLHFASLRLSGGRDDSKPQWEIEELTRQMCKTLLPLYPCVMQAFSHNLQVAP